MTILHICNSYAYNSLYSCLTLKLSQLNIKQLVFAPIRKNLSIDKSLFENSKIDIYCSKPLTILDRLFFYKKRNKLLKNIIDNIPLDNITLIHAHTLFSDGALALELKKAFNIKYIVTIRNTDINLFFKYLIFYREIGIQILKGAKKIIFISPAYVEILFSKYIPKNLHDELMAKVEIIPNGIHDFWLHNKLSEHKKRRQISRLIYVGDFTPNKNILSIIKVVEQINREQFNISLTLIGGGGIGSRHVSNAIKKNNSGIINYVGRIYNKAELLEYYRNSDLLVMPSFHETFGLVYLEAMSQGLPIIFSKGQGIDGYFKDFLPGYPVNPNNAEDIKTNVIKALNNIEELSINSLRLIDNFSWDLIAQIYLTLYSKI